MQSYPSPQILPHMGKDLNLLPLKLRLIISLMGKESSFLPPTCKANLPHTGKESCFLPRILKVHPSPGSASPQNATLPFPTEGRILPLQNAKSPQILPYKLFFVSLSYCFFHYYLFFFSFFPKLGILPQSEIYSPAFGANNRRIDALSVTPAAQLRSISISLLVILP